MRLFGRQWNPVCCIPIQSVRVRPHPSNSALSAQSLVVLLNHIAVSVNPNEMSAVLPRCIVPYQLFDLCLHFLPESELFCLKQGDVVNLLAVWCRTKRQSGNTGDDFTLITADVQSLQWLPLSLTDLYIIWYPLLFFHLFCCISFLQPKCFFYCFVPRLTQSNRKQHFHTQIHHKFKKRKQKLYNTHIHPIAKTCT